MKLTLLNEQNFKSQNYFIKHIKAWVFFGLNFFNTLCVLN